MPTGLWRGWRCGRSRIPMQALLIFRTTRDVVRAAIAITNLRGGGKRIAKVARGRGRWDGPHETSNQGCRSATNRGHRYSRLHVGFLLSGRPRHSVASGGASRILGFPGESRRCREPALGSRAVHPFGQNIPRICWQLSLLITKGPGSAGGGGGGGTSPSKMFWATLPCPK
jgi:hypothetical protein